MVIMAKYRKHKRLIKPLGTLVIEGISERSDWHLPRYKATKKRRKRIVLDYDNPDELGEGLRRMINEMSKG